MAAALMVAVPVLTNSCTDDDEFIGNEEPTEPFELPSEDVMSVTTNLSYTLYGRWDEDFGMALGRRLQGAITSPATADFVVIDPSTINHSDMMSNDELKTIVRRSEAGELPIVLTKATFREFYDFAQLYVLGALLNEFENYTGDHGYDSPHAAPLRRNLANVIRRAYTAGQRSKVLSRASVNGIELDWEHVNTWPEEKQNAIMFDGFAQCGSNELYVLNVEAISVAGEETTEIEQPDNDYEWGLEADAVIEWLNRRDTETTLTRTGLKHFAKAVTRAGGTVAISDLMNAQTQDFVFAYKYPSLEKNEDITVPAAIKVQYRSYSAYDFDENADYYQVFQNITVMNDRIHRENESGWTERTDDPKGYTQARGAWMKGIGTKMMIVGLTSKDDVISVESAAPINANGASTYSDSHGGSTTSTKGYSVGLTFGLAWNAMSGFNYSGSLTNTYSYSKSKGTTWNTSSSWSVSDLTTDYTLKSDSYGTVNWMHSGNTPVVESSKTDDDNFDQTKSSRVKLLLKSTCNTDENVIWKVKNPKGSYQMWGSTSVSSEICKRKQVNKKWTGSDLEARNTCVTQIETTIDLPTPDRFMQTWNNDVYDYGTANDAQINTLNLFLQTNFGNTSDHYCWAGAFTSTETTANGSEHARAIFQIFKNSINGKKEAIRAMKIGGRLLFVLHKDGEEAYIDSIALILDGTGYNVGETFTEKVNGYDLTFKVTKKGEEAELDKVPKDFNGVLAIPESVSGLAVTSLGDYCAIGCKGITAVTIPSTVKSIETGALAELNISSITIPEGVTAIGTWAFHADSLVSTVSLPTSLRTIGDNAFLNLSALRTIVIPEGVISIGDKAFCDNLQLETVFLPNTLKSIDYGGFMNCSNLREVHIKATTPPTLGDDVFSPRYDDAILYVPKGNIINNYKKYYTNASEWKKFKNIKEE